MSSLVGHLARKSTNRPARRRRVRNQWPSMHVLPATQGMPGRLVNCRSTVNTFRRPISLNLRTCTILRSQKYQPIQMSWHSRWLFSISRPAISWSLRHIVAQRITLPSSRRDRLTAWLLVPIRSTTRRQYSPAQRWMARHCADAASHALS